MTESVPGTQEWLDQVVEDVLEPELPIVDPHHHLWRDTRRMGAYLLPELRADTGSGHRVTKTVFVECRASYREDGPEPLKPVGETEFVAEVARSSAEGGGAVIAGIVGHADLTLGAAVEEVLAAHEAAGGGRFRGIRHSLACDPHPEALTIPGRAPEGLSRRADFREGLATLGRLGYSYDCWLYHHQLPAYAELARAVPGTTFILDHFGTPLGVGPYAGRRAEIFARWKTDIAAVAACPNVVAKLGGLAMPDNGYGWNTRATPATSDEIVAAHRDWYLHTIDSFGPERCMMESNFPVDKLSVSYRVLWNALKKMTAGFSAEERRGMFHDNAARVYRL